MMLETSRPHCSKRCSCGLQPQSTCTCRALHAKAKAHYLSQSNSNPLCSNTVQPLTSSRRRTDQLSRRPLLAKMTRESTATEPQTFILGLTGSIGMGKSTVSAMFRELGIPVWDADAVVHQLYGAGGAAVPLVAAAFPGVVIDGAIDRGALSARVVGNEAALKQLESLVHPLVAQSRQTFVSELSRQGAPLVVLDIPLLFETGGPTRHGTNAVAVVSAPPEVQRARVLARPGMTEAKLQTILSRQVPDDEKRRLADYVIDTSVDIPATAAAVTQLVGQLVSAGRAVGAVGKGGKGMSEVVDAGGGAAASTEE